MAKMTVYENITVKMQVRTSLPTDDEHREERRRELAAMLKQLRDETQKVLQGIQVEGWELVVTEIAR